MIPVQNPSLRVQDFPTESSWITTLFNQLNPFFLSMYTVLNNGVDFKTNINCVDTQYSISGFQPFSIKWPFTAAPPTTLMVSVGYNTTVGAPTMLLAAWSYNSSTNSVNVTSMLEVTDKGNVALTGKYTFSIRVSV